MTRDDIIRMAREADLIDFRDADDDPHTTQMVEFFERFAALIAAAEREKHLQEPVAWMCSDENLAHKGYERFSRNCEGVWNIPVYTAPAAQRQRMPDWMDYDSATDVLTIHGKRYSAAMFGEDGFLSPPGTLLRVEQGQPECVTLTAAPAQEPVAWMDVGDKGEHYSLRFWSEPDNRNEVPLYTTPPAAQPTGKAPCERHCEANAFKIEIRGLRGRLEAPLPTRKPLTEDQIVKCFRTVWPTGGVVFTTGAIAFAKAIEAAHQISDARQMVCEWKPEDDVHMPGTWASACGQLWSFIDGTPADNRVRYCHGCGRQVAEVHNPDQDTAP
jgi:hypothetical protein